MSDKINTGGPAFPSGDGQWSGGTNHVYGMTLRDYFAGQALIALAARTNTDLDQDASDAYFIADAMLAAREAK